MILIDRLIVWYGKRIVYAALALIVILLVIGGYFLISGTSEEPEGTSATEKRVTIAPAGTLLSEGSGIRTVGTVRAVSEARLQTESAGRVTAVNAAIGDVVSAGAVLASLENRSERAALLQAEGAYEAALAERGTDSADAKVSAQNEYRSAFTAADDAVRNLADDLFTNPDISNPSLRISGQGRAVEIGRERQAIEVILDAWSAKIQGDISHEDTRELLGQAEQNLLRISNFISTLAGLVATEDPNTEFTEEVLSGYEASFLVVRARLDTSLQSIVSTRTELLNAQQSENGAVSAADARIKQVLGSLRLAQASYEKTVVRSPISGTVNAMYLRANEYVGANAPAAVVANNNALEISTSVSEDERDAIEIGSTVTVEDTYKGTITHIAPAVDPLTGKIEVRVSVDATAVDAPTLSNGTTARLTLHTINPISGAGPLLVPMRALKLTAESPIAFEVTEDGTLSARAVVLGPIRGDMVTIVSGIDATTVIVSDARGLKEGEHVIVEAR